MAHITGHQHSKTDILHQIKEGMTVYDSEGSNIGTVETLFFGAASDAEVAEGVVPSTTTTAPDSVRNTFVGALADIFDDHDDIPEELAERLRYHGFIKVDGNWLGADRYVMPEQIASVNDEGVHLNTKRDYLIEE